MSDPRLTEERLRHYLDGNQPMRERMCLALLPLLGPYSDARPRRPKGGPDEGRDIECLFRGNIVTWGAVGFRNGGGNDTEARTAAQKKFRDDLDNAVSVGRTWTTNKGLPWASSSALSKSLPSVAKRPPAQCPSRYATSDRAASPYRSMTARLPALSTPPHGKRGFASWPFTSGCLNASGPTCC